MSDDGWRNRIRWVVVHPDREAVLVARRDGTVRLPEAEQPGQVWTPDPAEVLPGLRDLLGADAVLLHCLEEDEDPAARIQRAGGARQDLVPERARVHPAAGRGHRLADGAGQAPPERGRLTRGVAPPPGAGRPPLPV